MRVMQKPVISFDVDGTLVRPEYNELLWFKEIPERYAKQHGIGFGEAKKLVMREYERVGEDDVRWYILDYWLEHFGFDVPEEELLEKYAREVALYSDVIPVLDKLMRRGYTLVVASAMPRSFIDVKLKKDEIFTYFKKIFSAVSDFRMTKKEKAFYERMCGKLKIIPSTLIHVGDNYDADYLAPTRAGVKAFHLNRTDSHTTPKSHQISNLKEFVERIKVD